MGKMIPSGTINIRLTIFSALVLLVLLSFIGIKYQNSNHDLENILQKTVKKNEILSKLRINLIKESDFEKAAVMADTDELSVALADKAIQIADIVDSERYELRHLIEQDNILNELSLLREFDTCWEQFRKIDKILLDFAVENTNVKASALSFTEGGKALRRFESNMTDLINNNTTIDDGGKTIKLACDAIMSVLKIQYLHAPHISASNDSNMDSIETQIVHADGIVKNSLDQLKNLVSDSNRVLLMEAASAYNEFMKITDEVLKLSRQNTNIKSFELSLGRKRKIAAECDEILGSLQEAVRSRTFDATR